MTMSDGTGHGQPDIDDMGEWGEPQRPADARRRRLGSMISVRFTPAEVAQVRDAAARRGLTVSEFVRQITLSAATAEESVPVQVYNRVTYGQPSGLSEASTVAYGLVVQNLQPLPS
jgi:hypothetical protein